MQIENVLGHPTPICPVLLCWCSLAVIEQGIIIVLKSLSGLGLQSGADKKKSELFFVVYEGRVKKETKWGNKRSNHPFFFCF